jgi:DNA-directed RNA polymerase specialized sigma24 family protein
MPATGVPFEIGGAAEGVAEARGARGETAARSLRDVLDGATRHDERCLLDLSRRIGRLLERYGAYTVRQNWSSAIYEIALAVAKSWREAGRSADPEPVFEGVVKNRFWAAVLDLVTQNDARAAQLFFPTVRRLVASWDGSRQLEATWDDIVQDTAHQVWELWIAGSVERPWSMIRTVARRRYLDRARGARPTEELGDEESGGSEPTPPAPGDGLFTEAALAVLEPREREIIVRMDLEGETRVEIGASLGMTEGEVLATRRAGLRRIWRWLGEGLPAELRAVWDEMFKGARRMGPEEVAAKLALPLGEVVDRLERARALCGLA